MIELINLAISEGFTGIALRKVDGELYQAYCVHKNGHLTGPTSRKLKTIKAVIFELKFILKGAEQMKPPWNRLKIYPRESK